MKVIIAGGGTGGHVFPALAVGEELMKRDVSVLFVGTKKGLESELVHRMGWNIKFVYAPKWKGMGALKRIAAIVQLPFSILHAFKIVIGFRPDMVIGVGGYASAPIVFAAAMMLKPTLLMEQNAIPGLANRVLSHFAKKICVSFEETNKYFNSKKILYTGNPVRKEMKAISAEYSAGQTPFVLMCFGGSQGAKSINEAMFSSLRFLRNRRHDIKILHQVGFNMDIEIAKDIYAKEGFDAHVYQFITDIADCYSRASLVVCRAGATSIAELTVTGRPAVLIPYPFAANNHQEMNARSVEAGGGAIVLLNKDLSGEKLSEIVLDMMSYPEKLDAMSVAMKRISKPEAAAVIADECFRLVVAKVPRGKPRDTITSP